MVVDKFATGYHGLPEIEEYVLTLMNIVSIVRVLLLRTAPFRSVVHAGGTGFKERIFVA